MQRSKTKLLFRRAVCKTVDVEGIKERSLSNKAAEVVFCKRIACFNFMLKLETKKWAVWQYFKFRRAKNGLIISVYLIK